ncbi:MAG: HAD family hydrolase [Myxococcota bacterium]
MPRVRAIVFDLDNTLVDRDTAFRAWAQDSLPTDEAARACEIDARGCREELVHFLEGAHPDWTGLVDRRLSDWIAPYVPESKSVRRGLEKLELPLALVSNGSATGQRQKLERAGLDGLFESVVISGDSGVAKPDARAFTLALDALQVAPEDTLFVGDDYHRDIVGARRVGMHALWVNSAMTSCTQTVASVFAAVEELEDAKR